MDGDGKRMERGKRGGRGRGREAEVERNNPTKGIERPRGKFALSAKSFLTPRCPPPPLLTFLPLPRPSLDEWFSVGRRWRGTRNYAESRLTQVHSDGSGMANQRWAPFKFAYARAAERHLTDPKRSATHPPLLPLPHAFIRHRTLPLLRYEGLYFKC